LYSLRTAKNYVDTSTTNAGAIVREWIDGPLDTASKARESPKWQLAVPVERD